MDSELSSQILPAGSARGRAGRLFPRPFTVVSSLLYLGILALFFYSRLAEAYRAGAIGALAPVPSGATPGGGAATPAAASPMVMAWHWNEALAVCAVLALLAIDRVEYRLFGEGPPTRAAVGLLGLRVVLIEVVAQL